MAWKKEERARRMAARVIQTLWWFDAPSLVSLRSIIDRMIESKRASDRARTESIQRAFALQLTYIRKSEKPVVTEVHVENTNSLLGVDRG
jgi:hypothetical protein